MLKKRPNKVDVELAYYDSSLESVTSGVKKNLDKDGVNLFKTERGFLESRVFARAPAEVQQVLDYTKYAVVFIISSYFAGFFGQAGANLYQKLSSKIKDIVIRNKTGKSILLIINLDRSKNFPLRLCFVIPSDLKNEEIPSALRMILDSVETCRQKIDRYANQDSITFNYVNSQWAVESVEDLISNRGISSLSALRTLKLHGVCEEKFFPSRPGLSAWEYINEPIPETAKENALKHRIAYYQRLYTADDIKYAVFKQGGATISIDIFESILTAPNGAVSLPKVGERSLGQHSVMVCGYNKEEVIFANSWGTKWGRRGYGLLPWNYLDQYLVEGWAQQIYPAISFHNFWRPKFIKNLLKSKKEKKFITTGSFKDRSGTDIIYQFFSVIPLRPSVQSFFVLNFFAKNDKKKVFLGWAHLGVSPTGIEIEEMFIEPKNKNLGLEDVVLRIILETAQSWGIEKVFGWIGAEDCFFESQKEYLIKIYKDKGFTVSEDKSHFRGSLLRVEKLLI